MTHSFVLGFPSFYSLIRLDHPCMNDLLLSLYYYALNLLRDVQVDCFLVLSNPISPLYCIAHVQFGFFSPLLTHQSHFTKSSSQG